MSRAKIKTGVLHRPKTDWQNQLRTHNIGIIVDFSHERPVGDFNGQTDVAYFKRVAHEDNMCGGIGNLINKKVLEERYDRIGEVEIDESVDYSPKSTYNLFKYTLKGGGDERV